MLSLSLPIFGTVTAVAAPARHSPLGVWLSEWHQAVAAEGSEACSTQPEFPL